MKRIFALPLLLFVLFLAVGCEDDTLTNTDPEPTAALIQTTENEDGSFSTVVNAGMSDATEWIYFSFAEGEMEVTDPATALNWDLRFRFYTIQLNGGSNGSAGIELTYLDGMDYSSVTAAPAEGYYTDTVDNDAFKADGGWYVYNPLTHDTVLNERIWIIHLADGSYLKMELDNLVDEVAGTPGYPGFTWQLF